MKLFNKCFNNLSAFNTVSVFSSTHRTAWISFKSYLCTFKKKKKKRVMFSSSSSFQHFKARPSRHAASLERWIIYVWWRHFTGRLQSPEQKQICFGGENRPWTISHACFSITVTVTSPDVFFLNTRRYLRRSLSIFWLLNMKDVACGDTTEKSKL